MGMKCRLGAHQYVTMRYYKRDRFDKCIISVDSSRGKDSYYEKCVECGEEIDYRGVIIPSIEAPNPFFPYFDCICGRGNKDHQDEWAKRRGDIAKIARKQLRNSKKRKD